MEQSPSAGTEAPAGSTVTLTVAQEPPGGCDGNGNGNGNGNGGDNGDDDNGDDDNDNGD